MTGNIAQIPQSEWLARYDSSLLGVFGTPSRVLVRGEGAWVWDAEGRRYLDFLAGIAVNVLGHAHPVLTAAVADQWARLGHVSNFFTTPAQVEAAEKVLAAAGAPAGSHVFFSNSGTEANEAAIKLSRRTGRTRLVAAVHAFHGRTLGALALTYKEKYRLPFAPLPGPVDFVEYGDAGALEAALAGDDVAAVFLEPVQGEAGVIVPPAGYLARARELTTAHGALLVIDEVQSGSGRSGHWFAHQDPAIGGIPGTDRVIVPDVVTTAKGLAGGYPIGATITFGPETSALLHAGQHGSTFGGNPGACAAVVATLGVIESDGLLAHATAAGAELRAAVAALHHPLVAEVRGVGLLDAVELTEPVAGQVADAALAAGYIVNAATPTTLRLAPPLIVTSEQIGQFVAALPGLLDQARAAADQTLVTTTPDGSQH